MHLLMGLLLAAATTTAAATAALVVLVVPIIVVTSSLAAPMTATAIAVVLARSVLLVIPAAKVALIVLICATVDESRLNLHGNLIVDPLFWWISCGLSLAIRLLFFQPMCAFLPKIDRRVS